MLIYFNNTDLDCSSWVTVLGTDGSLLGSIDDFCTSAPRFLAIPLPTNGLYSIITNDGFDPGSVGVTVDDVSNFSSISVTSGPATLSLPANQFNALTFSGNAGDQVSFVGGGSWEALRLIDPQGTVLASPPANYFDSTTLPLSGTYLLLFQSYRENVNTTAQIFNAPVVRTGIEPGGSPVTVTAAVPGQLNYLFFTGTANEELSYSFANVNANGCFGVSVLDDNLNLVPVSRSRCQSSTRSNDLTGYLYSGFGGGIILPADGIYEVLVDPTTFSGSVSFSLQNSTAAGGNILIDGPPITMNASPGQTEDLTFTGNGDQLTLGISNTTYDEVWGDIIGASAANFDTNYGLSFQPNLFSGPFPTVNGEVYTIEATGESHAGSAEISLYDASPANAGSLTLGGGGVNVSGNPGQPILLTFDGSPSPTSISFSNSTFSSASAEILGTNGSFETIGVLPASDGVVSVLSLPPLSGTYTVQLTGGPTSGTAVVAYYQGSTQNLPSCITAGGSPSQSQLERAEKTLMSLNGPRGRAVRQCRFIELYDQWLCKHGAVRFTE